jgi:hypothetical protein
MKGASPPLRSVKCEAFFSGAGRLSRLCLLYEPAQRAVRGKVLYVPPFAEEMNRCRPAAAAMARALADAGWAVLQIDLAGCGDSAGEFADATWEGWLEDLRHGLSLLTRFGPGPLFLWGVRGGALLAADLIASRHAGAGTHLLLWQPVLSGAQHLQQWLRLRLAREGMPTPTQPSRLARQAPALATDGRVGGGEAHAVLDIVSQEHAQRRSRGASHQLRSDWIAGRAVEVGGYTISPALAFALDRAIFTLPRSHRGRIQWFDCVRSETDALALPRHGAVNVLASQGLAVHFERVVEASFWQNLEILDAPALRAASLKALEALA